MNTILMAMTFIAFLLTLGIRYSAQALVASLLGDGAPARDQRISLNSIRHLSPLGTCVALFLAFPIGLGVAPVGLGWGKAIRPSARDLRTGPNSGLIILGLTGIAVNLIIGIGVAIALGALPNASEASNAIAHCPTLIFQGGPLQGCLSGWQPGWALRIEQFAYVFAGVNILTGLLNIIPLYPLDGYHILFALLPERSAISYRNGEQIQEIILIGILFLVPFLLSLSGAPVDLNPVNIVAGQAQRLVAAFSGGNYDFFYLL